MLISNLFCKQLKTLEIKRLPPTDQKQLFNLSTLAREWVCDFKKKKKCKPLLVEDKVLLS